MTWVHPSAAAVSTHGLGKTYRRATKPAVLGVDLRIDPGELFGLIGPNGAGKSTTIGMLTTLVAPTSGRAEVCGLDVVRRPVGVKRLIGVVGQHNTLDPELTIAENLRFRGRCFGLTARQADHRAAQLLDELDLTEQHAARAGEVSGGQVRRAMIGRALVHRPPVLLLDEPTAGLDPPARHWLWALLGRLRADGQTVLLSTHYLEEAERLCDRVAVLDRGRLLACDTVAGLTAGSGGRLEAAFFALTGRSYQP